MGIAPNIEPSSTLPAPACIAAATTDDRGIFATYAERYWAADIEAIPLKPKDKRPAEGGWQRWGKESIPDDLKAAWLEKYPNGNIGIPAGEASGLSFVDIDSKNLNVVALIKKVLPDSPWERIGKKGCVLAFKNSRAKSFKIKDSAGEMIVEFFSTSGQVVAPCSIHPETGRAYEANCNLWDVKDQLSDIDDDIEDQLRAALIDHGIKLGAAGVENLSDAVAVGGRDNALTSHAGRFAVDVRRGFKTLLEAFREMTAWVEDMVAKSPGDDIDVGKGQRKIAEYLIRDVTKRGARLKSGWDAGLSAEQRADFGLDALATSETIPPGFTDQDMAAGFAERSEGSLIRIEEGGWASYNLDQGIWQRDRSGNRGLDCQERIKEYVTDAYASAKSQADAAATEAQSKADNASAIKAEETEEALKAAKACKSASRISGIKKVVESDDRLCVSENEFDADDNLLNVINGVLDLKAFQFLPHDPSLRLMKQCGVPYDPEAKCPQFNEFLAGILSPDTAEFLLQCVAASMACVGAADQLFPILYGAGRNGKSTFVKICRLTLGSYAIEMDPSTITRKKETGNIRTDLVRLNNKRAIFTSELPQGTIIDAALVKRMTGGTLTARGLYTSEIEFQLKAMPFIDTNFKPVINGADFGITRRLPVCVFNRTLSEKEQVPNLAEKIVREEGAGVLNRLLEALKKYRATGRLIMPDEVRIETEKFALDSDLIAKFMTRYCKKSGCNIGAGDMYQSYRAFCMSEDVATLLGPSFKAALEAKGYRQKKTKSGNVWENLEPVIFEDNLETVIRGVGRP